MIFGSAIEVAIVPVLCCVVLAAINGWVVGVPRPGYRGQRFIIKFTRLPFRFGVRSLLIAMTLIAALLWMGIYSLK